MIAYAPEVTGSSTNNTCQDAPVVKQRDFTSQTTESVVCASHQLLLQSYHSFFTSCLYITSQETKKSKKGITLMVNSWLVSEVCVKARGSLFERKWGVFIALYRLSSI